VLLGVRGGPLTLGLAGRPARLSPRVRATRLRRSATDCTAWLGYLTSWVGRIIVLVAGAVLKTDLRACVVSAIILAAGPACFAQSATESVNLGRMTLGYTYFNRPGADIATHNAAVLACAAQAAKVRSYDERSPSTAPGVVPALISGSLQYAYHHGVVGASLENCMVAGGWRVVSLSDAEGTALAALPPAELTQHLAEWVGAQSPHGQVVRSWGNDAALAATVRFEYRPAHTNNGQLSLLSTTGHDLTNFQPLPVT